ncbi:glycosyltransferase family 2 protein [Sutcliffiella rhizosphaerae]|uniref:Teichuronic acid biosynthesis glycosyltransferase TuaG n=1 Tax=Sutcliffiella rhizosphaerae TaxID=2880967 RepID=A0ABN8A8E0_9BACI|nr:glycosyltransferase family 2 protein [Sutcliffiella rhizosphaerae]CAG9621421.1 Putative teichuronic acid biosynthesis glycosyltransferase TuaG [Sutcliffiella rhizosphaerae]
MNDTSNTPLVSIVTPVYNAEKHIQSCIDSILSQTYGNWELFLVDDCSSDKSLSLIKQYEEEYHQINVIQLKENSGAAVARNTAIEAASGKYIAFLDSDDLWVPTKLEKQVNFMEEQDIAFSFTKYSIIDESGNDLGKVVNIPDNIDYEGYLKNTIIGCLTVMLNIEKIGKMKMPLIRTRQDFAFWLSILKKGHIAYGIQEPLAKYRYVEGSISSNKFKTAKRNWYVYRQIERLSFFKSLWCFVNYAYNGVRKRA